MPSSLKKGSISTKSSLPYEAEKGLLRKKVLLDRELKSRVKRNPLEYYWPHAIGCDGHCADIKHTYTDYYGSEYTIEGCPQYAFHTSLATTRGLFGSNRSGKTVAGVVESAIHLTGYYPDWWPHEKRWTTAIKARFFTTDFKKGVGEVLQTKIEEWFPQGTIKGKEKNNAGIYDKYWIKHESGKLSSFDIMTYEQQASLAEGWSGHLAWYDECPPEAHRIATLRGLTDFMGWEMFTATPVSEPYLYDQIYTATDPDIESFTADIRHNLIRRNPLNGLMVGLTEQAIRRYEREIRDPGEFDARIHGKFKYLTGRIWKMWDREVHIYSRSIWKAGQKNCLFDGQPPRHWQRIFIIDPHDQKPHALLWVAFEPEYERYYVYREAKLKDMAFCDVVKYIQKVEVQAREKIALRVMDPNFGPKTQGNNRLTVRDDFELAAQNIGYPMSFNFGDDNKARGRKAVQELMWYDKTMPISIINRPKLIIADDLTECIYDVEHYVWDEHKYGSTERDPKEKPKNIATDFNDILHYLALSDFKGEPVSVSEGYGSMYVGGRDGF